MDPAVQRLSYLNDAAHNLAASAPSIAAAFQARYDHIAIESEIDPPATRAREICSACGYNMLATAEYTATARGKREKQGKKRLGKDETKGDVPTKTKAIVLACSACLSRTTIGLPATKRLKTTPGQKDVALGSNSNQKDVAPSSNPSQSRAASSQPQLSTQNRGKAKRAKNRNSLHAMLAKSKEEAQSGRGFGFGLMDLMKSA
ncbi:rnase p rpr2 rpp21 snm1 subunit domain-containing protein [Venturia nashicola]|uniref:Rnase p rpr2 rpp21 snm1 subunit domain-containing protein n=1 Tax=Venturia nashicola TaxID=86259 RepID=A0A4Z1PFU3_9PEZI|nr:rnase p rpr2 rpp21 snm1 subunit domain-containing protein [Venturia nashicola]TLD34889.1 rnase p rpr2 rpp21 snm1 subunit domain-containing protein [Venturia nashicola]